MVRMLVLSDELDVEKKRLNIVMKGNVDVHSWFEYPDIPRLSDYEIAVLDMQIPDDARESSHYNYAFLGLRQEARILLESGGVIICLNYFTKPTSYKAYYHSDKGHPAVLRIGPHHRREINYDWLFSVGLLSRLNVAQLDAKPGKRLELLSKDKVFAKYFKGVTEYHKTIENVESKEDEEGNFLGYEIYAPEMGTRLNTKVIAVAKVTKKPIACVINILKGSLIFLPQTKARSMMIIDQLYAIGNAEYEKNIQKIEEYPSPPEWLDKYKAKQELGLERKIEDLTQKLERRKLEHKRFEKIDVLLYGTGNPLEVAVQKVLEEMGCTVEKLEKGATMDLKARINSIKFAIEVTGVEDKIYKDSKKFAQILQYLPHKEENEKIVLLANTYRDIDVGERVGRENFTNPVLKIAENNGFCLITTMDLYFMWKDFLNGKSSKKILAEVFSAKGEFRYIKS